MRDRIIHIIILLLAAAFSAHAQLGVKVGYTGSTHKLKVEGDVEKIHADGMTAGLTYDITLMKNLYLRPGLMYGFEWYSDSNNQITEYGGFSINEHFKEHSITIPLHLRYEIEIIPEILSCFVAAGPDLSIGISSTTDISMFGTMDMNFKYDNYDGDMEFTYFPYQDEIKDLAADAIRNSSLLYKRLEFGLQGSAGIIIMKNVKMELGYGYGLTDRLKAADSYTYRTDRLRFTICCIF
jgi:hypothetical protein